MDPYNYYCGFQTYPQCSVFIDSNVSIDSNCCNLYDDTLELKDYGKSKLVFDIEKATKQNNKYRVALWTGENLQLTLMNIPVSESIGLEVHTDTDQFIRVEEGIGLLLMGDSEDELDYQRIICDNVAVLIKKGVWHDIVNIGEVPLKLYSIYAPPEHSFGTIHETKSDDIHY